MADLIDDANLTSSLFLDANIEEVRKRAALIPIGEVGECKKCEEFSLRLVNGNCASCRDKYKLP